MSIQALPYEMLVKILSWVPLNNLGITSQVCKTWQEASSCDAIASCNVLTQEIDPYISRTQEIFQKTIDSLMAANAYAEKQAVQQQQTLQNLNQKIREEHGLSADERQSIKDQIQTLETSSKQCMNYIQVSSQLLENIPNENEDFLSKVNAHPCDDLIYFTKYSKLFNKKIMLLSELFNFCIFSTEKDEWKSNFPNVNYLTLSQSKMIIQELIAKKIENFERCINPLFTSEESFNKFEQLSKFHQLMDSGEKTISYTHIKNFIENRLQSLKTGSPDLTTLSFDFTPLILKVPFLMEQPNPIQYKGCLIEPLLKLKIDINLIRRGVDMRPRLISAEEDEITSRGIDGGLKSHPTKSLECANASLLMPFFLGDQIIAGARYKLRINFGNYVIISREFMVLDRL